MEKNAAKINVDLELEIDFLWDVLAVKDKEIAAPKAENEENAKEIAAQKAKNEENVKQIAAQKAENKENVKEAYEQAVEKKAKAEEKKAKAEVEVATAHRDQWERLFDNLSKSPKKSPASDKQRRSVNGAPARHFLLTLEVLLTLKWWTRKFPIRPLPTR